MRSVAVLNTALLLALAQPACGGGDSPTGSGTPAPPPPPAPPTTIYVAPDGSAAGDGSIARPYSLDVVMGHSHEVPPGTTIWLRGGTYRGSFTSNLKGTPSLPVTLRQYPGERAIIDGNLVVDGAYGTYWGFEVISTVSAPQDLIAVNVNGPGTKLVNLVVHDAGGAGFGLWTGATNAEVHGNIIYNNGRQRVIDGYSHGIYAQNASGTQRYSDNVVFNQYNYGFHMYGSDEAALRGFHLEGNVAFENGTTTSARGSVNILVGGGAPASGISVLENYTYKTGEGTNVRLGYSAQNQDLVARNNYFAGGTPALRMNKWSTATVSGNTLASAGELLNIEGSVSGFNWSSNTHYRDPSAGAWTVNGSARTFSSFTSSTGWSSDRAYSGLPTTNKVVVRPNRFEQGRAHVIVYNWTGAGAVTVDLSNVLKSGDAYEILNVQDLFGTPVVTGTYSGGSVSLPIRAVAPPTPVGGFIYRPTGTGTQFNTYLVRKRGS